MKHPEVIRNHKQKNLDLRLTKKLDNNLKKPIDQICYEQKKLSKRLKHFDEAVVREASKVVDKVLEATPREYK